MRFDSPLLHCCQAWLAGVILLTVHNVHAGDRRHVTEPVLPGKVCATLSPPAAPLQRFLDRCPRGEALRLTAGRYLSGPLHIPTGVTLWLDKGAVLAASTVPADYDRGEGRCGTLDKQGNGCRPFIRFEGTRGGGIVGDGTIDGQGGQKMSGRNETGWQLARRAQRTGLRQNVPRLIEINHASDITLYRIRPRNASGFHVVIKQSSGVTLWGLRIDTPASARNTDGIDPISSTDVTVTHCFIRTGDDNIAIKAGKDGPARHISILNNHLYAGHGMSIGSETQGSIRDVRVKNMTLDGTTSGLRIKSDISHGGQVTHIHYQNICLRGNRRPVDIDTRYNANASGIHMPVYQDIRLQQVHGEDGTLVIKGYNPQHPAIVRLDGVVFAPGARWQTENTHITVGHNGVFPLPPGSLSSAPVPALPCHWIPFPDTAE